MKRRKVLKRRLVTYEQADTRLVRAEKARDTSDQRIVAPLYGNVKLLCYIPHVATDPPGIRIEYVGKHRSVRLAVLYRTPAGTLYEVHGVGGARNKPSVRKSIDIWKRYVSAFTPHDSAQRLYQGDVARYLLTGGAVLPVEDHEVPGAWLTAPRAYVPHVSQWATRFPDLPNFTRRCRLFATRLRKAVEGEGMGVVQPANAWRRQEGLVPPGHCLHVCAPPQGTRNGRRLVVQIAVHDRHSRAYHHIDGDYGIKHCQFFALEDGKKWSHALKWKCARDAIIGIKEWLIGDIYIPGPG